MDSLFEKYFQQSNEYLDLDLTLDRINNAVGAAVGSVGAQVVHIAGTNGKGSTSQFIAELLERQGFSTLLFTSPHITDITERLCYKLTPISRDRFNLLFMRAEPFVKEQRLTYFEAIFLMAMIYCKDVSPDYLILEAGLGGRYDATNTDVIQAKTPVITSISQDHKEILGYKIAEIVSEKAAVIKGNNPVFMACNPDFILNLFRKELPETDFRLPDLSRLAEAQKLYSTPYCYNYLNAHNVVEYLTCKEVAFEGVSLPMCRQEVFGRIMLDGAHNPAGIMSLFKSLTQMPDVVILSGTKDRDIEKFCMLIERYVPDIILTTIPDNPRSVEEKQLAKLGCTFIANPLQALSRAKSIGSGNILVTGSLYLCAWMRRHLAGAYE